MYKTLLRSIGHSIRRPSYNLIYQRHCHAPNDDESMEKRYDRNRQWLAVGNGNGGGQRLNTFKLVSYNILAQDLLLEHLFLYLRIEQQWLIWRRRLHNIQKELAKLQPDIVCLQEMQYDHLPQLVQRLAAAQNKRLEYVYKKKTGRRTDGCAIIYDAAKFQLLEQRGVEYYEEQSPLLNRENVALLARFQLKSGESGSKKELVVATTHLLYNPRREDVRCAQVQKLLGELHSFASDAPVVLTGDFNATADSMPLALLTAKRENELNFEALPQSADWASTHQSRWLTVDYILRSTRARSKNQLQLRSFYALPSINCCCQVGAIPNHYLGSDHYALGAVFALT